MRRLLKIVGALAGLMLLLVIGLGIWLYFYTADLPPTAQLSDFNPSFQTKARFRSCDGVEHEITVIPEEELGRYTVAAAMAAEGKPQTLSPFVSVFLRSAEPHVTTYQVQLARQLVCTQPSSILKRQLQELRLANAINRRFRQPELLTIYLNSTYFGSEAYGIEAGAQKNFGKHASTLTLDQTALLVGMIRAPGVYSPVAHPDRAEQRRNSILDNMVIQGSLTQSDADRAKATPIQNPR